MSEDPPFVAVIGAGPAGLMAAEVLAQAGRRVVVFERMPSPGRKLLMAGRGGLNLTHSEDLDALLARYGSGAALVGPAVRAFPPAAVIAWCHGLGQETFVGTSGRVFPRTMKASPLLRAWLQRLARSGVTVQTRHRLTGWQDAALEFETPHGPAAVHPVATILAAGGASWPRLGTDGTWLEALPDIPTAPFRPSNCGFRVAWSDHTRTRLAGQPLKRIAATAAGVTVRGEATITADGIEGGAIYALSPQLRDTIAADGRAILRLDLRPDLTLHEITARLAAPRRGQSLSTFLRKTAGLDATAIGLVQEALHDGALPDHLPALIKSLELQLIAAAPIDRAISTVGGIIAAALDARFMLRDRPGVFAAGEMLDWEAPTGGYLLQACFATGFAAARGALAWLDERAEARAHD